MAKTQIISAKAEKYIKYVFTRDPYISDLILYLLNPENYRTNLVTLDQLVDFFDRGLLPNGVVVEHVSNGEPRDIIYLDENDGYSVKSINYCINQIYNNTAGYEISSDAKKIYNITHSPLSSSYTPINISDTVLRKAVFDERLFIGESSVAEFPDNIPILFAAEVCYKRLILWQNFVYKPGTAIYLSGAELDKAIADNREKIITLELVGILEDSILSGTDGGANSYLSDVFNAIYKDVWNVSQVALDGFLDKSVPSYKMGRR